jgi:mandelamide amidase
MARNKAMGISEESMQIDFQDRRRLLKGTAAAALMGAGVTAVRAAGSGGSSELHNLGLAAAARAIRDGSMTSETYATALLGRARSLAGLNSFISIDENDVLAAARAADKDRAAGKSGALLGVPIGIKDSYMTHNSITTFGTKVLSGFKPNRNATMVTLLKESGGIAFGKNNLAEMSYGLTGFNEHHGQVKNPFNQSHITGGSSSGAGASVAARIVPAALGGDTVGSIRVPASLCGVVGFKPTPGRWSVDGTAPISSTLDALGVLTRAVEDCILLDGVATRTSGTQRSEPEWLKGLRLAYAPKQYLQGIDPAVERLFIERIRQFKDAGAEIVEVDLGDDFTSLVERTTWPVFFHETMPEIRQFLAMNSIPVSFEQIYSGLGSLLKARWSRLVVSGAPGYFSEATYKVAMEQSRPELQRRYNSLVFAQADALIFPATACAAPTIENQWKFSVAGNPVMDTFLAKNAHPTNCAGLPGISLPMGLLDSGLPVGIELDARAGSDKQLLGLALRVERVIGRVATPTGI